MPPCRHLAVRAGSAEKERSAVERATSMVPAAGILAPGERVRIRALKDIGSARLLDGLTGQVLGPHPLARGWYKLHLEPNTITPYSG